MKVQGVLLIFNHPLVKNAPTIMEHVDAFCRHSRFKVWKVNSELGFPKRLDDLEFQAIVLHYSLFGYKPLLSNEFLRYLGRAKNTYKMAFFQDEHRFCKTRFNFINHYELDCVFTLVEPAFFCETYKKYTEVVKLIYCLPGYVSDTLIATAQRVFLPDEKRGIDVGYRGRNLEYYMGREAREKVEIGIKFRERAEGLGLKLDIETEESERIYGEDWYRFIANCRSILGVEAGVSIFDLEDVIYERYKRVMAEEPKISFEKVSEVLNFRDWEGRIYYRTISPRHFEAAAFKVCQILYEGKYSGVMKPMVHYIPLKKDFSNFGEVIEAYANPEVRRQLADRAYHDMIESGKYTYERFVRDSFDPVIEEAGLEPERDFIEPERVTELLSEDSLQRFLYGYIKSLRHRRFPGRSVLIQVVRVLKNRYSRWKGKASQP